MSVPPDSVDLAKRLGREVVMVGVDASVGGLHALWHARDLAEAHAAQLVVVFVHHLPTAAVVGVAAGFGGAAVATSMVEADVVKERVASMLADFAGSWEWHVMEGDPARQLSTAADEFDADLIVVGPGRHGARRRGVARRLLQYTTRTVLVCGGR